MRTRISRGRKFTIDRGASVVEYGLLVGAIAVVIMGVVFTLGDLLGTTFQQTQDCLVAFENAPSCDTTVTDEP